MGLTNFPHGLTSFGIPIYGNGGQDISGTTYFVDNNSGNDGNDGFTWDTAFKTFAKAVAISNIDIARGSDRWARRNTIYYCADTETATLVAFPNKCDVIGCGSYDANKFGGITGNHAPVNAGNYGTRFINVWFKAPAVASPIITLASTSAGIEFWGCMFDGVAGTVTTGITATASTNLKVNGCKFIGGFATAYISLATGAMLDVEILDNNMHGAAATGILINSGTTVAYGGLIKNNFVSATTVCINDASSKFHVINNRCITAAAQGTAGAGAIVAGAKMMQDNRISASDVANAIVPAQGSLA